MNVVWRTVTRALKRLGASYRRARRVPAKPCSLHRQQVMQRALDKVRALVRALAKRGVCDLYFGDESGFSLVPVVPYLWQEKGKTVRLAAQSHQKRLNVMGLWKEAALEGQEMIHLHNLQPLTSHHFVRAIEERLLPFLRRPCVLVVDNARVHRCALVLQKLKAWKAQGLRLWFLPPYCPHLNRLELVWQAAKYRWIEPHAYQDFPSLCDNVNSILSQVGNKYSLSFG